MSIAPSSTAPGVEPYPAEQKCLVDVYVWELPVRIAHWAIFVSMVVLSVTGVYIGNPFMVAPGEGGQTGLSLGFQWAVGQSRHASVGAAGGAQSPGGLGLLGQLVRILGHGDAGATLGCPSPCRRHELGRRSLL